MTPSPIDPTQPQTILVVDDVSSNIMYASALLQEEGYCAKGAASGRQALEIAAATPPDLILLDVEMPNMDGYEVCRALKTNPRTEDIPVIFLTGRRTPEDEERGLLLGAVDYLSKPISPPILAARVRTHLTLRAAHLALARENADLDAEVNRRLNELHAVQDITMLAMTKLARIRDNETGHHIQRTQTYVSVLISHLRDHPRFKDYFASVDTELLAKSASLHDIGKIGIPDAILLKPGKLTEDEFETMKQHTTLGRDAITAIGSDLAEYETFLEFAREIAYSHHEKWDGSGYPRGLSGEDIPVSARLMAVADVYDALISARPYKAPMTHFEAIRIMENGKGTHFDPDILNAFLHANQIFNQVAKDLADI